jgi:hypothetical protein
MGVPPKPIRMRLSLHQRKLRITVGLVERETKGLSGQRPRERSQKGISAKREKDISAHESGRKNYLSFPYHKFITSKAHAKGETRETGGGHYSKPISRLESNKGGNGKMRGANP